MNDGRNSKGDQETTEERVRVRGQGQAAQEPGRAAVTSDEGGTGCSAALTPREKARKESVDPNGWDVVCSQPKR